MQMLNLAANDYLSSDSFAACVTGLFFTISPIINRCKRMSWKKQSKHCLCFTLLDCLLRRFGIQKIALPDWEILLLEFEANCRPLFYFFF